MTEQERLVDIERYLEAILLDIKYGNISIATGIGRILGNDALAILHPDQALPSNTEPDHCFHSSYDGEWQLSLTPRHNRFQGRCYFCQAKREQAIGQEIMVEAGWRRVIVKEG